MEFKHFDIAEYRKYYQKPEICFLKNIIIYYKYRKEKMIMSNNVGIITEQGDLGLGFDPLSEKDQKTYNESTQKQDSEKENKNNR